MKAERCSSLPFLLFKYLLNPPSQLDPHGADGNGNPVGGLVYGNTFGSSLQYHEWTSFISDTEFCFRACVGANAATNCQHIYDEMGCYWNMRKP